MLKKLFAFSFLIVLISSCGKDEEDLRSFNIKLQYNNEPLVMFEEVDYPDGSKVEFTRFSFYMSTIVNDVESGTSTDGNAYFFDLTASHSDLSLATEGFSYNINRIVEDDSSNISFNLGVEPERNAMSPQDFASNNDLSKTGEYWSDWGSYVFAKFEGLIDIDGDGIKEAFALHLGSDAAMRTVSFPVDTEGPDMIINVDQIFNNNGNIFDLKSTPRIHSLSLINEINTLMDNFASSIEIK